MRPVPLPLRMLGGALLAALIALSALLPLVTPGECASLIALGARGKPYAFGKDGPDSYDCSGLARSVCANFGVELVHSAQFVAYDEAYPTVEDPSRFLPGDLVFFDTVEDGDACDHVGFWIGMGRFVHASSSEGRVMVSRFDETWRSRCSWAKRVLPECARTDAWPFGERG